MGHLSDLYWWRGPRKDIMIDFDKLPKIEQPK